MLLFPIHSPVTLSPALATTMLATLLSLEIEICSAESGAGTKRGLCGLGVSLRENNSGGGNPVLRDRGADMSI